MKKLLVAAAAALAAMLAVPASATHAQSAPSVILLHGIPGVPVDVYAMGAQAFADFQPGDMQDISALAGQTITDVALVPAGGALDDAVAVVDELSVPTSGSWTIIAHLDADGAPVVTTYENDTSAVPDGQGRLTVRHNAAAPAVDLLVGGNAVVSGLANPDEVGTVVPAGEIAGAQIAPAGGEPIADVPTVTVETGVDLIVYAVGSLDDGTFTFYTQEVAIPTDASVEAVPAGSEDQGGDGTPAPTAVNTGDAIESSNSAVVLFAAAAGLFAVAGGALAMRRRNPNV